MCERERKQEILQRLQLEHCISTQNAKLTINVCCLLSWARGPVWSERSHSGSGSAPSLIYARDYEVQTIHQLISWDENNQNGAFSPCGWSQTIWYLLMGWFREPRMLAGSGLTEGSASTLTERARWSCRALTVTRTYTAPSAGTHTHTHARSHLEVHTPHLHAHMNFPWR